MIYVPPSFYAGLSNVKKFAHETLYSLFRDCSQKLVRVPYATLKIQVIMKFFGPRPHLKKLRVPFLP